MLRLRQAVSVCATCSDICQPCYKRLPCGRCSRCQQRWRGHFDAAGVCARCLARPEDKPMKPTPSRKIVCCICGQIRTTQLKKRDICQSCAKQEPSVLCSNCGRPTHCPDAA